MRIERVVIENLNSLAGRFEIDLNDRAYSGGLFAIVGPSGSGKTTVMDAMCLALYGRTPRIGTVSDTQDELMNKYEDTCAAEVVFTSRGKRYRSRFEHGRTVRGSKPFRAVKREVCEQAADGSWRMVAASIREAESRIEELTGLNFERFTRSIMLAQFRFAEFLQAGSNDRAAILEQMTDMDIYRRISMAAYERAKQARLTLQETRARIAEVSADVLSEERVKALEDEREQLDAAIPQHEALKKTLTACLDGIGRLRAKEAELAQYRNGTQALADTLAQKQCDLAKAEKQETAQKQAQAALAETLKAVRVLDQQTAAQQDIAEKLSREIEADTERINKYKREVLALFKKYMPGADNETFGALYHDPNVGPRLLKSARDELKTAQREDQALLAQMVQTLQHKDEAYWQQLEDVLGIAVPVADALAEINERKGRLAQMQTQAQMLQSREKDLEKPAKEAEDRLLYARLEQRFGQERQNLKAGQPCPLCGATEHPDAEKQFDDTWLNRCEKEHGDAQRVLKEAHQKVAQATAESEALVKQITEKESFVQQQRAVLAGQEVDLGDPQALRQALADAQGVLRVHSALARQYRDIQVRVNVLTEKLGSVDKDVQQIDNNRRMIQDIEVQKQARENERKKAQGKAGELREERERLFGAKSTDAEEMAAEMLTQKMSAAREQRRKEAEQAERAVLQNRRDISRTQEELDNETRQLEDTYALLKTGAAEIVPVSDAQDPMARFEVWSEMAARLEEKPDEAALRFAGNALSALVFEETAQKGALLQILKNNEQSRGKLRTLKQEENTQKRAQEKWETLNSLIGSADGSKFSRIAQSITFESLLRFANMNLKRMSDRYVLVRDDSNAAKPLELAVIDTYQAGERRPVANLSGGESFIVSLALALGLSEMSSGRARIDSLFIDEGFASLDENYMEAALQTLSTLGSREGKLVGVISHVESLKERIDVQIEVKKLSGGRSTLMGPGVKANS
jgi:exonuclease SbcC